VTTFLADIFHDLANDPSWPWEAKYGAQILGVHGEDIGCIFGQRNKQRRFIAQSPLNMARLALMVVEERRCRIGCEQLYMKDPGEHFIPGYQQQYDQALKEESITPSHYANVKKRVEEAKR